MKKKNNAETLFYAIANLTLSIGTLFLAIARNYSSLEEKWQRKNGGTKND